MAVIETSNSFCSHLNYESDLLISSRRFRVDKPISTYFKKSCRLPLTTPLIMHDTQPIFISATDSQYHLNILLFPYKLYSITVRNERSNSSKWLGHQRLPTADHSINPLIHTSIYPSINCVFHLCTSLATFYIQTTYRVCL